MATGKDWETHYMATDIKSLEKQREAITTLEKDELFYNEFKSTGIFELRYFIDYELLRRK